MSDATRPPSAPQRGEPGTVAVTVENRKATAPPTYRADMAGAPPKLRVKDLCITYIDRLGQSTEAVRDVSFDIEDKPGAGEIVVFLGPSGCGKSTILKAVAGLLTPTKGEILIDGKPIADPGRDRGMVFRRTSFGWLTVRDNVSTGCACTACRRLNGAGCRTILASVGLAISPIVFQDLSGGMKQRVAIARTLINEPRLVLMDEPFGALGPQTRWGMQGLLLDVSRTADNTMCLSHDVSEAVYLADTIYVLSARPARILHRVDVPFFANRDIALKSSADFRVVEKRLLDLLYTPAAAAT